jgi:hypothetical protein
VKKKDIRKIKVVNFNHEWQIDINELKDSYNIFIIKKGRKNLYFLEVEKILNDVFIQRYNYKDATFSKYGTSDLYFQHFNNLKSIKFDFIENFDKISQAKNTLEKFGLL